MEAKEEPPKEERKSREQPSRERVVREKGPPLQALKRFANMLQHGDLENQLNYELNQQRINDFLQKTSSQEGMNVKNEISVVNFKLPGLYDYSNTTSRLVDKNLTTRFNAPECQKSLGPRSRFGDGDGSYWDKWINSDSVTLHTESLVTDRPHIGFKRLYGKESTKSKPNMVSEKIIQPYAVRNAERKRKEANEQAGIMEEEECICAFGNTLQAVFDEVKMTEKHHRHKHTELTTDYVKLPPLDPADKETYFGEKARASFFDFYRQVGRQRYALDDPSKVDQLISSAVEHGSASSVLGVGSPKTYDLSTTEKKGGLFADDLDTPSESKPDSRGFMSVASSSKIHADNRASPLLRKHSNLDKSPPTVIPITKISKDDLPGYSIPHFDMAPYPKHPGYAAHTSLPEDKGIIGTFDPVSPRTKFIVNCIASDINPKPHLLIRKGASSCLDIGGQGIGDKLAQILAQSLDGLPYMDSLNISNNKLTDSGLAAVINILPKCASLTSLNLSQNKIDLVASAALSEFLNSSACRLTEIVLNKADIDDNEAGKFLAAIKKCTSMRKVELSSNLLGSHELMSSFNKNQITCGDSVGELLSDPQCRIETLILSWNKIRDKSADKIALSVKLNASLTHLDLSFNKLGEIGGQLLGNALFDHKTLKVLDITSNEITPKACFVIVAGIHACKTLNKITLMDNPIGEVGTQAVMMLQTILGDDIDIDMRGCSVRLKDKTCTFDYQAPDKNYELDLSLPYERAQCAELLRIASYYDYESLVDFKYTPDLKKNPGSSATPLDFEIICAPKQHRCEIKGKQLNDQRNHVASIVSNTEVAKQLFALYSCENPHKGLGKAETTKLFKELGLIHSYDGSSSHSTSIMSIVNKMYDYYDVDGTGIIHEKEFFEFMSTLTTEITKHTEKATTFRYMSIVGTKKQYVPPEEGKVTCSLSIDTSVPAFLTALSHESTTTLINAAKNAADGARVMNYALKNVLLRVDEGILLYSVLLKEIGNKYDAMLLLLPKMASTNDARGLLEHVSNRDVNEKMIIKHKLGHCFRVYIGHPNGFYSLDLKKESDKLCLKRLVELSAEGGRDRITSNCGDTSQCGNWSCFRNTVLDGKKVLIDLSWFGNIDDVDGELEFDFVYQRVAPKDSPLVTNTRLCNLLSQLHMTNHPSQLLDALSNEDYVVKETLAGHMITLRWKFDRHCSYEMYKQVEWCSEHYANRDSESIFSAQYLEDNILMSLGVAADPKPVAPGATATVRDAPIRKGRFQMRQVAPKKRKEKEAAKIQLSKAKNYSNALKSITDNDIIDREIVSIRTIDALEDALAGRFLTCCQLAAIIKIFPGGNLKRNNFGTMRVELIISFYSFLIDVINFDRVMRVLTPHEIGMIVFRLGWLNVWCPIRADSYYYLNLSRREEKQMARMLLVLDKLEKCGNMTNISYMPQGVVEKLVIKHYAQAPRSRLNSVSSVDDRDSPGFSEGSLDGSPSPRSKSPGSSKKSPKKSITKTGSTSASAADISQLLVDMPLNFQQLSPEAMIGGSFSIPKNESEDSFEPIIDAEEVDNANEAPVEAEITLEANSRLESIPTEWLTEDGLPDAGCLLFEYDCNASECDNKARVHFSSLTLPQAMFSRLNTQPSIMDVDEHLGLTPYRYSFVTEHQKKPAATLPTLSYHDGMRNRHASALINSSDLLAAQGGAGSPGRGKNSLRRSIVRQDTVNL